MSAAAEIKSEPPDETPRPAPTVTLTGQDRTDRELQECNAEKCSEDLRKLREEASAEGQIWRNLGMQMADGITVPTVRYQVQGI